MTREHLTLQPGRGAVIEPPVGICFFSVPAYRILDTSKPIPSDEILEPAITRSPDALDRALSGAEYRDVRARDWLYSLLSSAKGPQPSLGSEYGPASVFARPPSDLPAILRLSDQLEAVATRHQGERALVWKCHDCATRYAVPITLFRPVSIRCEKCGNPVELAEQNALGLESLLDPLEDADNRCRRELAKFLREAMARGWPVLVCSTDP